MVKKLFLENNSFTCPIYITSFIVIFILFTNLRLIRSALISFILSTYITIFSSIIF